MWLFVGLGNPGKEYSNNRHNIGFMTLDAVQNEFPIFGSYKSKFQGKISEGRLSGEKVILLKPQTYMNSSGQSVKAAVSFYKIEPENIIVFHDEIDISFCQVRVKQGGGNAGHNGLKSIQAHLGTPDFWRVRMGVGRPTHNGDVSNYVLSDFSRQEHKCIDHLIEFMGDNADIIISDSPNEYEKLIKGYKENGI